MGVSTNGMLVYGFDLGGAEGEWKIAEVDEYGRPTASWFIEAQEDEDGFDLTSFVEKLLQASQGFTETDYKAPGYFDRRRGAQAKVGVEVVDYCMGSYPMFFLAAFELTARRGDAVEVDFPALEARRVEEGWDAKLVAAIETLGITPTEGPRWYLASWWSD